MFNLLTKKLLSKLTLLFDHKYNENKPSSVLDAKHFFKINKKGYFFKLCNCTKTVLLFAPQTL